MSRGGAERQVRRYGAGGVQRLAHGVRRGRVRRRRGAEALRVGRLWRVRRRAWSRAWGDGERHANAPIFTTGQTFLHSCRHFLGLQRSTDTMAMRSRRSLGASSPLFFLGAMMERRYRLPRTARALLAPPCARKWGGKLKTKESRRLRPRLLLICAHESLT